MRATSQDPAFRGSLSLEGGVRESCRDGVDYLKIQGIEFLDDWWQGRSSIVYGWRPPSGHALADLLDPA